LKVQQKIVPLKTWLQDYLPVALLSYAIGTVTSAGPVSLKNEWKFCGLASDKQWLLMQAKQILSAEIICFKGSSDQS